MTKFLNTVLASNIFGSTAVSGNIIIEGTSNITKDGSLILLQPNGGKVGISTGTYEIETLLQLGEPGTTKGSISFAGDSSGLITIQPQSDSVSYTLTLPNSGGDANQYMKTDGSGNLSWSFVSIVDDTTPQLSGDLDLNENNIQLISSPVSDITPSGITILATVDAEVTTVGTPLYMASDGHFEFADADDDTKAPCVAMALETGTGIKKVLLYGVIRNDDWNWSIGPGGDGLIFLSTNTGTLSQTQPTGTDNVIQVVGWALSADIMFFCPQLNYMTHV